ncbi:MAG: hypothetical protein JNN08_03515 [Bryobacterales bacterium]|nr:hypothetical protein [Bryobacterales bacterium]
MSPKHGPVLLHVVRFHQLVLIVVKDSQQLDFLLEKVPILVTSLDELRICLRKLDDQPLDVLDIPPMAAIPSRTA